MVKPEYSAVLSFSEGLSAVSKKGLWGFVDKDGWPVIPPQFDAVDSFLGGKARVRNNKSDWFYVNAQGSVTH